MTPWKVQLLGTFRALRNDEKASLQSKERRALLASLLLENRLTPQGGFLDPQPLSRSRLANRYWSESDDPHASLRKAIQHLKRYFGEDAFTADGESLRANPGHFVTDIEEMMRLYGKAQTLTDAAERLHCLLEAEKEIGGKLLDYTERGVAKWVEAQIGAVITALLEAHRKDGNFNAAFDTALRLRFLCPYHPDGEALVWELSKATGQEHALPILAKAMDYESAILQIAKQQLASPSLTALDTRQFEALLKARLCHLDKAAERALFSLAVFPAAFSASLAKAVCSVSTATLHTLQKAGLLDGQAETYSLHLPIQRYLWRLTPSTEKRLLNHRHKKICTQWLQDQKSGTPPRPELFATVQAAKPHVELVLERWVSTPLTSTTLDFLFSLDSPEFRELLPSHLPLLESAAHSELNEPSLRSASAQLAGEIHCHQHKFREALPWFDLALTFVSSERGHERNRLLFQKAQPAHYGGNSEAAVSCLREIIRSATSEEQLNQAAPAHRFLCEVLNHLQKYEEALLHAETAYTLYLHLSAGAATLADARFWQGKTLLKLLRATEAESCIHEALELWQGVGDKTGVGHCLRTIAGLQMEQKQYALAQANLDHAISLHLQTGSEGCRIAAVEVLEELCWRRGRHEASYLHLQDCLQYHRARGQFHKVAGLQAKVVSRLDPQA